MATIKIHNWKVAEEDDTNSLVFIEPEYHPTYWEIPKWWYKGDRTVYTSCVRVDVDNTMSLYIDGTSPLMQIQIDWDGSQFTFSNWRDIRRILGIAKDNLGPVNRDESDAYSDIEFTDYKYELRVGNFLPIPPLVRLTNTTYHPDNVYEQGSEILFTTATYEGGSPPVGYRWRGQQRPSADVSWVSTPWTNYSGEAQQLAFIVTEQAGGQVRIQSQARDNSSPVVQLNGNGAVKTIV